MFDPVPNPDRLLVEVHDGRWNAYGNPNSITAAFLMKTLNDMGGISDTVTDGYYYFSAEMCLGMLVARLEPYQES